MKPERVPLQAKFRLPDIQLGGVLPFIHDFTYKGAAYPLRREKKDGSPLCAS